MIRLRDLGREEAPAVAALEKRLFSDPWSETSVLGTLSSAGGFGLALFEEELLLGYVLAEVILGEGELLRIGVSPEAQSRGLGARLLDAMLAKRPEAALWRLDVRAGNVPAIRLYESRSFRTLTRNKNFYREPAEDGLLMMRESC